MKLTLTTITAAALILHGLGHTGGYWMLGNSWLLAGNLGGNTALLIGSVVWLAALVGFVGAGLAILGYVGNAGFWRKQAVISAALSLAIIVVFAGAGLTWNIGGAVVGNLVTLAAVATASLWKSTANTPLSITK